MTKNHVVDLQTSLCWSLRLRKGCRSSQTCSKVALTATLHASETPQNSPKKFQNRSNLSLIRICTQFSTNSHQIACKITSKPPLKTFFKRSTNLEALLQAQCMKSLRERFHLIIQKLMKLLYFTVVLGISQCSQATHTIPSLT